MKTKIVNAKKMMRNNAAVIVRMFILSLIFTGCNKVTVTTDSGPNLTHCGGFDWRVRFDLKNPSKGGGWMVQEVTVINNIKNCDGTNNNVSTIKYWEAWEIKDGQAVPDLSRNILGLTFDDMWVEPDHPNTNGDQDNPCKIRYFEGVTLPATMVQNNPNTPNAGILHADTVAPPFWNNRTATADHNLFVSWNCCGVAFVPHLKTEPSSTVRGIDEFVLHNKVKEGIPFLIQSIPSWISGYDTSKTAQLKNVGRELVSLPSEELRKGIVDFYNTYKSTEDHVGQSSKVYLLLRLLFDVPESISKSEVKVYGGWGHPSAKGSSFNLLWPLAVEEDSSLVVKGGFSGYYGLPYDAAGEYDFFSSKFKRREIIK